MREIKFRAWNKRTKRMSLVGGLSWRDAYGYGESERSYKGKICNISIEKVDIEYGNDKVDWTPMWSGDRRWLSPEPDQDSMSYSDVDRDNEAEAEKWLESEMLNIVLMQYTGLKDNTKWEALTEKEQKEWIDAGNKKEDWNGKEIYEGDIEWSYRV